MQAMESQFDVRPERSLDPSTGEQREAGGAVGQGHLGAGRRLSEGGRQREEEDRAGERRLLQRGDHRQPGQAAGRVEGNAERLREQVRRHLKEAGDP